MARHYQRVELFHQHTESGVTKYAWQDVTADVYNRQDIEINPPRGDEQAGAVAATASLHLKTHRYNPKNAASDLYGLIGQNTPIRIGSGDVPAQTDTFTRTVASGWAGTGALAWTLSGGTVPGDYSVNGSEGVVTHTNTGVLRHATVDTGDLDHRVRFIFDADQDDITGAAVSVWALARVTDTSNYYAALASRAVDQSITVALYKRVGGVLTQLAAPVDVGFSVGGPAGFDFMLDFYVEGPRLYAKCWYRWVDEPLGWMVTAEDTALTGGTSAGAASRRETGNTNSNLGIRLLDFTCVPGTIRFSGEVESWQPRRSKGGDKWVEINAYDVWNRVDQSKSPLRSALWREIVFGNPVAFWPIIDGKNAPYAASALPGGTPLSIQSLNWSLANVPLQWEPVSYNDWLEPIATPVLDTQLTFFGPVSMDPAATEWAADCVFTMTDDASTLGGSVMWLKGTGAGTSSSTRTEWIVLIAPDNDWSIGRQEYTGDPSVDPVFTSVAFGTLSTPVNDGTVHHARFSTVRDGADVDWEFRVDNFVISSGTMAGSTWQPLGFYQGATGTKDAGQTSMGFVAIWDTASPPFNAANAAVVGRAQETAGARLARLFGEEQIAFELLGDPDTTEPMGPQLIDTLAANAQACEDVDMGLLHGSRHQVGMTYRTREHLYAQVPVELDFAAGEVSDPLDPAVDTRGVVNDVTVSRIDGSSARSVAETGPLNVNPPHTDPQGVGRYDIAPQVSAAFDSQLQGLADWRRFRGTQDVARYPQVPVDLDGLALHHKTALIRALVRMRLGDRLDILNLEGEPVAQLVPGYTETLNLVRHLLTFNAVPAAVYDVGIFNDPASKYDSAYSTTAAQITTGTSTSLSVAVEAGRVLWVTGSGPPQFPIDINLLGARLRVTAISGASSPQTFTVSSTVVNGIAKIIPAGTPVRLWSPRRFGL